MINLIKNIKIKHVAIYVLVSLWVKNLIVYTNFDLGVTGLLQQFLLLLNPIPIILGLMSIVFLFNRKKRSTLWGLIIIDIIYSIFLFANVLYYKEFTDFLSINTILGAKSVANGLGGSAFKMFHIQDLIYLIDIPFLIFVVAKSKREDVKRSWRLGASVLCLGALTFSVNLFLAEVDRPQLLTRTFDKNYIVKYLGLGAYLTTDGYNTYKINNVRASASENSLVDVLPYVQSLKTSTNSYTGIAKGKNVVYIHLESFQQFLIDYKLKTEDGVEHEVTPFINSLYHGKDSLSFSNAFHQVGQGKTSDAETMIENSIYGLPEGSAMVKYGTNNTFESAPNIFNTLGYETASFHGNVASFWNRDNAYKSFGYQHFYDASWYNLNDDNTLEYGLKDKNFFDDSIKYMKELKQPYYAKFLTVSNHFPYAMEETDNDFPVANTDDDTINYYFRTANYLDKQLESFFTKLKEEGMLENTVFVLYGDHYGISNSRNKTLAPLLGKDADDWTDFDNSELQRVPLIYYMPGYGKGEISDKYVGQIDMLPTLLDLVGFNNKNYVEFGQSAFAKENDNRVVFRKGTVVTNKYTIIGSKVYNKEGVELEVAEDSPEAKEVADLKAWGENQLSLSDKVLQEDLLRFNSPEGFKPVAKEDLNYKNTTVETEEDSTVNSSTADSTKED